MIISDGTEYLALEQLIGKIKQELFIHGGRVNTVDLVKELNLELNEINLNISNIIRGMEVQIVGGSLIANYYLKEIAQEININLQIQGQISVGELTVQFNLPADVLQHGVLEKYLGTIIFGRQDPSDPTVFYTEEFITRTKARIQGALMGLLKPTSINTILTHFNFPEELFEYLYYQLNDNGAITTQALKLLWARYLPYCFIKSRNDYLIRSYKERNYLEYFTLIFFNIPNEKEHLKRILHNEDTIFLKGCVMDVKRKQQLETALQECIASESYLNVGSFLNFDLYDEDMETFLNPLLENYQSSIILFDKIAFSIQFIKSLEKLCLPMTQKNAESVVISGKYQQYLENQLIKSEVQNNPGDEKAGSYEEHRKKTIPCIEDGSTQGMENKTVKNNSSSKQVVEDSNLDKSARAKTTPSCLKIIYIKDVEKIIKETLENEGLDNFVTPIAKYIRGNLNHTALALAKEFDEKLFQDAKDRKFTHYSAQDRIIILMNDIKLYEKGLKLFPSDQQPQFIKYLLKSFGNDVLSEFCKLAAKQCNLSIQGSVLSVEDRNKIINDLSEEYKKPLHVFNTVLAGDSMEQFYEAIDLCLSECGMIFKNINKKKDRLLVHNHKEKLISEIENCEEPALVLHLVVLVLFTIVTQNMLHASGRQVPLIILFLKSQLKEEDFDKVQKYHEMVSKYLTAADEEKESIDEKLKEDLASLRSIITDVKKYKL